MPRPPSLPLSDDTRQWIERRMAWLEEVLGAERCLRAPAVVPTPAFFPDPYTPTEAGARAVLDRVCGLLGLDPTAVDFYLYAEAPPWDPTAADGQVRSTGGTGGLYHRAPDGRHVIGLNRGQLDDPPGLVATLTHEAAHAVLAEADRIDPFPPDGEPLTDLCTVFLGLGVLTANAVVRETATSDAHYSSWSVSRSGYLPMPVYGYALAWFARRRGEVRPAWVRQLRGDVRGAFRQAVRWFDFERDHPGATPAAAALPLRWSPVGKPEPEEATDAADAPAGVTTAWALILAMAFLAAGAGAVFLHRVWELAKGW